LRIRLKHFLRPARSLRVIRQRVAQHSELRQLIRIGRRRFGADPRYRMESVEQGFAPRSANSEDDTQLLQRICDAYSKAMERQSAASETFQPNRWWRLVEGGNLGPVKCALAAHDLDSLRLMYRNFFRDPCGAGLVGLPGIARHFSRYKELFLIDALHRIDLWQLRTADRFPLADLATPDIGNPLGVVIEDTRVRTSSEDQHFYAHKIIELTGSADTPVVAEIGGGFGGMAYFLLRDRPGITYLDFDVPESIALASWYLLKAFPRLRATLYGEAPLNAETMTRSDIVLMPGFMLPQMPDRSVDVSFNSHVLSDMSAASIHEYLAEIVRTTRGSILHVNGTESCRAISAWLAGNAKDFALVEQHPTEWNTARSLQPDETECLYTRSQ
jgi:putative sugar O-methyltransferase